MRPPALQWFKGSNNFVFTGHHHKVSRLSKQFEDTLLGYFTIELLHVKTLIFFVGFDVRTFSLLLPLSGSAVNLSKATTHYNGGNPHLLSNRRVWVRSVLGVQICGCVGHMLGGSGKAGAARKGVGGCPEGGCLPLLAWERSNIQPPEGSTLSSSPPHSFRVSG